MQRARFFRVNAFIDVPDGGAPADAQAALRSGNPAAVVLLSAAQSRALSDARRQSLAAELALSETAFVTLPPPPASSAAAAAGPYGLRWFTPVAEVALCGHATLAAAAAVLAAGGADPERPLLFRTNMSGDLVVRAAAGTGPVPAAGAGAGTGAGARAGCMQRLCMTFPLLKTRAPPAAPHTAAAVMAALGLPQSAAPREVYMSDFDLVVVAAAPRDVRAAAPDLARLAAATAVAEARGVILAAPVAGGEAGKDAQFGGAAFVSRFFAPALGVDEDPVTGSAHCALAARFVAPGQTAVARQLSSRGGRIEAARPAETEEKKKEEEEDGKEEKVQLSGVAVVIIEGTVAF